MFLNKKRVAILVIEMAILSWITYFTALSGLRRPIDESEEVRQLFYTTPNNFTDDQEDYQNPGGGEPPTGVYHFPPVDIVRASVTAEGDIVYFKFEFAEKIPVHAVRGEDGNTIKKLSMECLIDIDRNSSTGCISDGGAESIIVWAVFLRPLLSLRVLAIYTLVGTSISLGLTKLKYHKLALVLGCILLIITPLFFYLCTPLLTGEAYYYANPTGIEEPEEERYSRKGSGKLVGGGFDADYAILTFSKSELGIENNTIEVVFTSEAESNIWHHYSYDRAPNGTEKFTCSL